MKTLCSLLTSLILSATTFASPADTTFTESDITLVTQKGNISGTLLIPDSVKISPVVLIIAGSGPTDRNGNNPLAGNNNSLKMLAEELGKNGISSVRYDKRGIAKSK